MAKIGNETRLVLKLAKERMWAKRRDWIAMSSNPNSNSSESLWMAGYICAWEEWIDELYTISTELER